jgi:NAD(P)-dependent dehydrogenase (short-subunit alcohol dehydrogenase family)
MTRPDVVTAATIFDVSGARTIVTGGASGLGLAMAEAMLDGGATVAVTDISSQRLEAVQTRLAERLGTLETAQLDICDHRAVDDFVAGFAESHGGLDVVFVNAGIGRRSDAPDGELDLIDDSWRTVLETNLVGAYATIRAAAAVMRRAGAGRIIVTCSTAGLRNEPWVPSAYIASKTALTALVKQAALDLAPHGVLVNAIAPGPFRTNIGWNSEGSRPPRDESEFNRRVPMGRVGDPSEIKGLALLLASPAGSFITGSVMTIDGGAMVHQVV